MPKRIQRKRTKGYRLPDRTLCATRPSVWGNVYPVSEFGDLSLPLFRNSLRGVWDASLLDGQPEAKRLRAYDLHCAWQKRFVGHPLDALRSILPDYDFVACFCPLGQPCHVDSILELANV